MKEHARLGGDALSAVERQIKRESFLTLGKEIAYHHHEWWDGSGYPDGRKGEEIPLSARIVALADVYDALTTDRPYKKAIPHERSGADDQGERGTHFDPDLVDVFVRQAETFQRIKLFNEFEDNPEYDQRPPRSPQGERGAAVRRMMWQPGPPSRPRVSRTTPSGTSRWCARPTWPRTAPCAAAW